MKMILQPERRKFMSNAKKFDSFAISASAGCGKTEEMAIRLLGMFLSDPEPEKVFNSVMAVTFSQSGAREIYNRIIEILFDTVFSANCLKRNTAKREQRKGSLQPLTRRRELLKSSRMKWDTKPSLFPMT